MASHPAVAIATTRMKPERRIKRTGRARHTVCSVNMVFATRGLPAGSLSARLNRIGNGPPIPPALCEKVCFDANCGSAAYGFRTIVNEGLTIVPDIALPPLDEAASCKAVKASEDGFR